MIRTIGYFGYYAVFIAISAAIHYWLIAPPRPHPSEVAAKEIAKIAREVEQVKKEIARAEPPAPSLARSPAPASSPAPSPSPDEAARREEQELARRLASLDDAARAEQANVDDAKVPAIKFTGGASAQDYVHLQQFYGMKVVVYPPSRRFLATFDLASGAVELVADPRAFMARFHGKRAIAEQGAYWSTVAEKVARRMGVARADDLVVLSIFPNRTARYLGWKELEVCRKAGVNPTDVALALCTYERRPNGTWIVKVIELQGFDGRHIPVRDFEGGNS